MGIELPPELADVAAQAGVTWPEADEEAMADQAQAWRDTAKSMSTLATDADTTARSALASISGETGTAAATEWKTFVEPDTGHLTAVVRDANAAADRLEHAANQVGAAKVEIVRNLVGLAQNQDAANTAAAAGHPMALAGLDTAVRGTAANVANIESHLISAVQPTSGVDVAAIQNPVNANPGHHLLAGTTTALVDQAAQPGAPHGGAANLLSPATTTGADLLRHGPTSTATDLVRHAGSAVAGTADQVLPGAGDLPRHATDSAADLVQRGGNAAAGAVGHLPATVDQALPGNATPGDLLPSHPGATPGVPNLPGPSHPVDVLPGQPGGPGLPAPGHPADSLPGDPEITGPVPATHFPGDAPTPPTGQTVQAGFAGGLEPSAAPAATNLPPAAAVAPPLNPAAPALGGTPGFTGGPVPGAPPVIGGAPPVGAPGGVPAAAPTAAPAAQAARPAAYAPAPLPADRPADPAPRKQLAGPPGAPPPARGERNEVLAAFWMHMFPIGHLPVASYRPARQLQAPPPELDYAAGLRFEPGDHPQSDLVDPTPRLAELKSAFAQHEAAKAAAEAQPAYHHYAPPPSASYPPMPPVHPAEAVAAGYPPAPLAHRAATPSLEPPPDHLAQDPAPNMRPVAPSAGLTADHPTVQGLLENHDPLGGGHERDWDRRYLVRLGSVTAHGISPEGLEYNWPTSEQYPEGGSASGEPEVLETDTVIDRFGTPHGRVFAQDSTPFPQRSLPPAHKDTGYRRYKILKPLPVWRAVSAAWFGQPGGGVRYRTTYSAAELVALGYLEEIA